MKRYASHCFYLPSCGCSRSVVEVDEVGIVHDFFPLQEETSTTFWLGGVIFLSPFAELEIRLGERFADFLKRACVESSMQSLYAWHVSVFDFVRKEFVPSSRLIRLG